MNYKWLLVVCCVNFTFILNPESFVIKKAKQILVAPKDQVLEVMGNCLEQNPAFLETLGNLMKQYAQVQQLCTTIVKAEVEGTDHMLCHLSDDQLHAINDSTNSLQKQIKLVQKSMQTLQQTLQNYHQQLQQCTSNKKKKSN